MGTAQMIVTAWTRMQMSGPFRFRPAKTLFGPISVASLMFMILAINPYSPAHIIASSLK
jgi:hypothetical protein